MANIDNNGDVIIWKPFGREIISIMDQHREIHVVSKYQNLDPCKHSIKTTKLINLFNNLKKFFNFS